MTTPIATTSHRPEYDGSEYHLYNYVGNKFKSWPITFGGMLRDSELKNSTVTESKSIDLNALLLTQNYNRGSFNRWQILEEISIVIANHLNSELGTFLERTIPTIPRQDPLTANEILINPSQLISNLRTAANRDRHSTYTSYPLNLVVPEPLYTHFVSANQVRYTYTNFYESPIPNMMFAVGMPMTIAGNIQYYNSTYLSNTHRFDEFILNYQFPAKHTYTVALQITDL